MRPCRSEIGPRLERRFRNLAVTQAAGHLQGDGLCAGAPFRKARKKIASSEPAFAINRCNIVNTRYTRKKRRICLSVRQAFLDFNARSGRDLIKTLMLDDTSDTLVGQKAFLDRLKSSCILTAQVSSIRHRVRGYERVLVATALFATLGITGFAAPSSGDDAHITVGPIGILGIPEETAQLVASLQDPEERTSGGIRVILGKLANQSVVLCQVGFGKVNAGMAAALLIQKFSPSAIIFTGNAGALNPNYIQGDVVLATDLAEYDFGQLSNGSFAPWQTRSPISRINNPLWFHPAPWLLSAALKSVPSVQLIRADTRPEVRDPKICEGAIVTGDTFVSDASKVQELRTNFNADGVEMEGAAVAQICSQYGIPLLVIRSITDRADGSSYTDYHNFVRIAAQNSSAFVVAILNQLQSQGSAKNPREVNHWLLAFELAFSEGSPYALEFGDLHTLSYEVNEQISAVVLQKIISISLDELAAAKIGFHIMPGAYQHNPIVPSGQLEIATDEVRARATLDVIGYLAQQGLVIGSSKGSAGNRMGLEILGRNGDLLKDRARLSELWNAFLAAEPKLLTGFSGIHESDQAGILIIDTGGAWLTGHASDLSVKFPEIGSTLPVSLSGTLFFFSYIEAENDWTSRADGADYIDDLVWLGFKKVAQDIPRHKRAIEQTIRDAIAKFAPLLKGRSMGTLGVEPEPLFRRQEYPNPRE
jgi:adenosylhomocysteine nucleosidase